MTQTVNTEVSTEAAASPQARVDAWLASFESALKGRDIEAAAGLFATESYWRDLVSFTWNITTVEGRDGVSELLTGTLENTDPSGFATEEPPDEADGVVTAWITFETGVGRGRGLLRLKEEDGEDRAWTLLTTLHELKGHEEPRQDRRPMGAEHGANKERQTWLERQQAGGGDASAAPPSPTSSSSAVARPASVSAPGCDSWASRAWSSTSTAGQATSGAAATSPCACTTRSGTTTCPT